MKNILKYLGKTVGVLTRTVGETIIHANEGYREGKSLKCIVCKKEYNDKDEQSNNYKSVRINKVCLSCFKVDVGSIVTFKIGSEIKKVFIPPDFLNYPDFLLITDKLKGCEIVGRRGNTPKRKFRKLCHIRDLIFNEKIGFKDMINFSGEVGKEKELEITDIEYDQDIIRVLEEAKKKYNDNC